MGLSHHYEFRAINAASGQITSNFLTLRVSQPNITFFKKMGPTHSHGIWGLVVKDPKRIFNFDKCTRLSKKLLTVKKSQNCRGGGTVLNNFPAVKLKVAFKSNKLITNL